MRLLLATGLYPPEIGGPATYAKLFEQELPRYGIEVLVLPFGPVRTLPPIIRHIAYAWLLSQRIGRADLVLVQDTVSTGLPVALICMLAGKKFIVRVPGDYAWEQGVQRFGVKDSLEGFQKRSYGLGVFVLRAIQRFVVRRAIVAVAPSKYLAGIISGWGRIRRIDIIYNGVELVQVRLGQEEHVKGGDVNRIVSSGRLVPWKGFEDLIDIVAVHKDWRLDILGDGPQQKVLKEKIQNSNAGDRIALRGRVSHSESRDAFARATVFVLNSRYEGLSHTLIEAMSVGTPIIATKAGGNPEVIVDGVNGVLVDPGDKKGLDQALVRLLGDDTLRNRLGAVAQERAKDFSIEKTVEATAQLLKSV